MYNATLFNALPSTCCSMEASSILIINFRGKTMTWEGRGGREVRKEGRKEGRERRKTENNVS